MTEPTPQGLVRYPETEGYHPKVACTCTPRCAPRCDGTCGCSACAASFMDFCRTVNFFGPDGELLLDEAEAAYQEGVLLGDFPGDGLAVKVMERAPPPEVVPYGKD